MNFLAKHQVEGKGLVVIVDNYSNESDAKFEMDGEMYEVLEVMPANKVMFPPIYENKTALILVEKRSS